MKIESKLSHRLGSCPRRQHQCGIVQQSFAGVATFLCRQARSRTSGSSSCICNVVVAVCCFCSVSSSITAKHLLTQKARCRTVQLAITAQISQTVLSQSTSSAPVNAQSGPAAGLALRAEAVGLSTSRSGGATPRTPPSLAHQFSTADAVAPKFPYLRAHGQHAAPSVGGGAPGQRPPQGLQLLHQLVGFRRRRQPPRLRQVRLNIGVCSQSLPARSL